MPAAYDIYSDQLRELRRGQPLYYPEPSDEGPVEIGDVGYTRQGAFCRLFNAARPADDPAQVLGVPQGFQPLVMGRILTYEAALEPGPLHSKTVFRVSADVGTTGAILPADASFRFSCTSSRGAILMLETQMSRQQALHDNRFKNYLLQNCLSWYSFARDLGIQVEFGDIMLVTECSKTAAWASAVYSQSSKEFGVSFSAGGSFLPSVGGASISAGFDRVGSVEYRRSQQRAITLEDIEHCRKDHTVFIRGYRLGSRSLYLRSLARKIMKAANRAHQGDQDPVDLRGVSHISTQSELSPTSPISLSQHYHPADTSLELLGSINASAVFPEWPDFHPAVALLAHVMETTDVEIAAVHDDEWCSSYSEHTCQIIDDYAYCFLNANFLAPQWQQTHLVNDSFLSSAQTDGKSIVASEDGLKVDLLKNQRMCCIASPSFGSFHISELDLSIYAQRVQSRKSLALLPAPPKDSSPDTWQVTLLGDTGVGKTALVNQIYHPTLWDTYDPRMENTYKKEITIDQQDCCLEIVDTPGRADKYAHMVRFSVRQSSAFVFVYSTASRSTFDQIRFFYEELLRVKRYRPYFVLVANQIDKHYMRQVSTEEGEKLAETLGCKYFEVSARTAIGVQKIFVDIIQTLRRINDNPERLPIDPRFAQLRTRKDIKEKHKACILM